MIEDHVATNDEELSVRVGDIIEIRDEDGSFWKGSPGNYTPGESIKSLKLKKIAF